MIWIYILATLLAQAIVVVLLMQFIDRKQTPTVSESVKEDVSQTASGLHTSEKSEVKETDAEVVKQTNINIADLKAAMAEVIAPIVKDCVETALDARDVQFESSKEEQSTAETKTTDARMSPEEEARAFEDNRDVEEKLEREDNSVTPPNTFASGLDFDTLTEATTILQADGVPTPEESKIVVKFAHSIEGTEFSGMLPASLLAKLYECHRRAELNDEAFKPGDPTDAAEVDRLEKSVIAKANPHKEEKMTESENPVAEVPQTPKKVFSMAELRNKNKQNK